MNLSHSSGSIRKEGPTKLHCGENELLPQMGGEDNKSPHERQIYTYPVMEKKLKLPQREEKATGENSLVGIVTCQAMQNGNSRKRGGGK